MKDMAKGANTRTEAGFPMPPTVEVEQCTCMNPKCRKPLDPREARLVNWLGRLYFFCSEVEAVRALHNFQSSGRRKGRLVYGPGPD